MGRGAEEGGYEECGSGIAGFKWGRKGEVKMLTSFD